MSKEDQKRAVEELRDLRIPESGDESEHCEEKSEVDELDSNASNCGDDASELDSCSNNGTEEQSTVHANAGFDATSGPELETDNEAQNSGNVVVAPVDNPSSNVCFFKTEYLLMIYIGRFFNSGRYTW